MKKIISLILSMLMLSAFMPSALASYTDTNDDSVLLVSALGLMNGYDDGTFLPENNITRAEFAQIIANIYKEEHDDYKAWKDFYFKDTEAEMGVITDYTNEEEPRFSDVDSMHWAYDAVMTVYRFGYMEGVSETEFAPDDKLTAPQIYKILSVMLGYGIKATIKGGYPQGYIAVARDIGLSKGISSSGEVTRADVAKILTNAFDVEMLYLSSIGKSETYETYEGKTFLTEIIGLHKVEGKMTDNGLTSLSEQSKGYDMDIVVANKKIRLTDDTDYLRDFIGRSIDIYYKIDEDKNVNTAVYGVLNNKDLAITFDADDFVGADINSISYKLNDTTKKLPLKNGTPLIKNGMAIEIPTENDFKVNKGKFTVIKSKGSSAYDLIILDSYVSFYVEAIDTLHKKIYSSASLIDGKCVDFSDENKTYVIYNSDGTATNFEAITKGNILSVSDSSRRLKVYISSKAVTGAVIDGKNVENTDVFVTSGNSTYRVSKDFIEMNGDVIDVLKKYTLYLDVFGEIINAEYEGDSNILTAFMIDVKNFGTISDDYQIKYFGQDGAMKTSQIASKVTFINSNGVETIVKDMKYLLNELTGYGELFRYKLDSDKRICYIELAMNQLPSGNPKNRLLRLKLDDSTPPDSYTADPYYKPNMAINGKAIVDNNTTIAFVHPSDFSNEDTFRVTTMPNVLKDDGNTGKHIKAYTTEGDSSFANYVVSREDVAETLPASNKLVAIVKDVTKGINLAGEPMNVITVYENGTAVEKKLYCTDDVINNVRDIWGRKHSDYDSVNRAWSIDADKYTVEMGDIIRYITNADGTLKKIQLIFDENAINPHSGGQGNLAGSYGYYNSQQSASEGMLVAPNVNSNPYALQNGAGYDDYDDTFSDALVSGDFWSKPLQWSATELRSVMAYPVVAGSNYVKVTTQDLSVNDYEFNYNSDYYTQEVYKRTTDLTLYVIEGNKLFPTSIKVSDLKTYNLAGNECDRMYLITRAGNPYVMIPIRGKTSN